MNARRLSTTVFSLLLICGAISLFVCCLQPELSEEEIQSEEQRVFSFIPEYCVKDMAQWFRFLVQHCSSVLKSLPVRSS